jgi:hypothetical protein
MAASEKMAVIWGVAPCGLVEVYHRFKRWWTSTRLYGVATQMTAIFAVASVKCRREREDGGGGVEDASNLGTFKVLFWHSILRQ